MVSAVGFVGRAGWCARLMWAPRVSAAHLVRMLFRRRSHAASLSRPQRSCGIRLGLCEPCGPPVTALAAVKNRLAVEAKPWARAALGRLEFGVRAGTKCLAPVQASARVAGERPRVPSKFSFKWEPETCERRSLLPTYAHARNVSGCLNLPRRRRRSHSGRAAQKTGRVDSLGLPPPQS